MLRPTPPTDSFDSRRVGKGALIAALLGGLAGGGRGAAAAGAGYVGGAQIGARNRFEDELARYRVDQAAYADETDAQQRAAALRAQIEQRKAAARQSLVEGLDGLDEAGIQATLDARERAGLFADAGVDRASMAGLKPQTKMAPVKAPIDPDDDALKILLPNYEHWQKELVAATGTKNQAQRATAQKALGEILPQINAIMARRGGQPITLPDGGKAYTNAPERTPSQMDALAAQQREERYKAERAAADDEYRKFQRGMEQRKFGYTVEQDKRQNELRASEIRALAGYRGAELGLQGLRMGLQMTEAERDAEKDRREAAYKAKGEKRASEVNRQVEGHTRRLGKITQEEADAGVELLKYSSPDGAQPRDEASRPRWEAALRRRATAKTARAIVENEIARLKGLK